MKKRRIKKSVIKKGIILLLILTAIIILIITNNIKKYHNTNEYKLKQIGYTKEEINTIINLKEEDITYLLNNEYIEYAKEIINQKYYIPKNFQKYIEYKKTSDKEISKIISIINTERDKEEYTETKESDINLKQEMLVNKYNYLNKEYKPKDIIEIPSRYAYDENYAPKEMLENYKEMFFAAEEEGLQLIITSAYRSYEEQEETYECYKTTLGEKSAKEIAALPGYSEHQTGLAFDVMTSTSTTETFENTKEYEWLKNNAYKYGFILRYPKDKEDITGYAYESWHYRYVGKEIAKKIKEENITYDEYYAYYIENKQ